METSRFAEFVASQQIVEPIEQTDWNAVLQEWLRDLKRLHAQVLECLAEYVDSGSITYGFTDVEIAEENLGTYTAKRLDLHIGRQQVSLVPVGTLFIGYKGVVDVVGSAGSAQLVLVGEKVKSASDLFKVTVKSGPNVEAKAAASREPVVWVWKIETKTLQRQYVSLDKESLFTMLMEVANA